MENKKETLEYAESESMVLATYLDALCNNQMLILPKAIKKFGRVGIAAAKEELKQMHDRMCFWAMAVHELPRREKEPRGVDVEQRRQDDKTCFQN